MSKPNDSDLNKQTFWQALLDIEKLRKKRREEMFEKMFEEIYNVYKRSNNDKRKNNQSKDDRSHKTV